MNPSYCKVGNFKQEGKKANGYENCLLKKYSKNVIFYLSAMVPFDKEILEPYRLPPEDNFYFCKAHFTRVVDEEFPVLNFIL